MKKNLTIILTVAVMVFSQCTNTDSNQQSDQKNITDQVVQETQNALQEKYADADQELLNRGVAHAASLWRTSDGTPQEFKEFCLEQFIGNTDEKKVVFEKISNNFESLWGHQNKILLDLNKNMHELRKELGEPHKLTLCLQRIALELI